VQGLPADNVSTDNAVLITQTQRFPLLIDPQLQGETWLQNKEAVHGLRTMRMTDDGMLQALEQNVRMGTPVLFHGVGDTLDNALNPLLKKDIQRKACRDMVRIGDADVEYNPNFRLYMTTKLSNPHFMPEVYTLVAIINFLVTPDGLKEQLLTDTVRHEHPRLEEERDQVIVALSHSRSQLIELQDRILTLLQEAAGNILDNEDLIHTLDSSRATSDAIKQRLLIAEATEHENNVSRNKFVAVPERASIIFFEITALPRLDPMYQYSLEYFKQLFLHCLTTAAPSDDPQVYPSCLLPMIAAYPCLCCHLLHTGGGSRGLNRALKLLCMCMVAKRVKSWTVDRPKQAVHRPTSISNASTDKRTHRRMHVVDADPVFASIHEWQAFLARL
jgi:dynein heavy chain, axonemal